MGVSRSLPLPCETQTSSTDLRQQVVKELPDERAYSSSDLQRSRSEFHHRRHNGISDSPELDGTV